MYTVVSDMLMRHRLLVVKYANYTIGSSRSFFKDNIL